MEERRERGKTTSTRYANYYKNGSCVYDVLYTTGLTGSLTNESERGQPTISHKMSETLRKILYARLLAKNPYAFEDVIVAQTPQFHVTLMAPEEWIYKATQSELTGKHTGNRGTWQRHYFGERRDRGFNGTPRLMACLHERVIRFPPMKSHRRKWQNAVLEDEGLCKATSRENQSSWQSFEGMPCTLLCDVCD